MTEIYQHNGRLCCRTTVFHRVSFSRRLEARLLTSVELIELMVWDRYSWTSDLWPLTCEPPLLRHSITILWWLNSSFSTKLPQTAFCFGIRSKIPWNDDSSSLYVTEQTPDDDVRNKQTECDKMHQLIPLYTSFHSSWSSSLHSASVFTSLCVSDHLWPVFHVLTAHRSVCVQIAAVSALSYILAASTQTCVPALRDVWAHREFKEQRSHDSADVWLRSRS